METDLLQLRPVKAEEYRTLPCDNLSKCFVLKIVTRHLGSEVEVVRFFFLAVPSTVPLDTVVHMAGIYG